MKIIIAGGRDFKGSPEKFKILLDLNKYYDFDEVVSGGARGADAFGEEFANQEGIPLKIFKADWGKFGKRAGYLRNVQMGDYADAVVLFAGGKGTAMMREIAKEKGLEILYDEG